MKIEDLIQRAANLAPALAMLPKILTLLRSPNSGLDELIEMVRLDPPLTAQILKASNSAFFAGGTQVYDISEAVNRIGFQETYRIVGLLAGRELLEKRLQGYFTEDGEMWENSLFSAMLAEKLSTRLQLDANLGYALGLLHGIGKFVLNQAMDDNYKRLYQLIEREGMSMVAAEREVYGFDHAEVGASLLKHWKFSSEMVVPVKYQYRPQAAPSQKKNTAMLHLVNYVVASLGLNYGRQANAFTVHPMAFSLVQLREEELESILLEASELIEETRSRIAALQGDKSKQSTADVA